MKSQFSNCPLFWMFCSRNSNILVNKVHERAQRVVLNGHASGFKTLLQTTMMSLTSAKPY